MDATRQQEIEERAYALWEAAGRPEGDADRFWHEAQMESDGATTAAGTEPEAQDPPAAAKPGKKTK
ncbi:DUF2934 domain-containing protein [Loktanella sp. M215]|uniref:DUF2934 domain-containing protein n=1 Tax=Loktanella sp. M215 TaxID=2675431 RepID=UPI001F96D5D4|nr:DUF2934 domain-containing protein [Loktanella sp. M215]